MAENEDPFFRVEPTLLRPRPGGGRRGGADPGTLSAPPAFGADAEPLPPAARALLGVGLNPLVRAASPLLMLAGHLRGTTIPVDVAALRVHVLEEIRRFEEAARAAGVQNEIVLSARYGLCASLDEAVLSTPWGSQSEWAQHPLLVAMHREAWGGEKFFDMLERISTDPARFIDLMELLYLAIAFGFAGKYRVAPRGQEQLTALQHDLYRTIRDYRGSPHPELALRWRGLEDRRNRLIRFVPWWVVGVAMLVVLTGTFIVFYTRLAGQAAPVQATLARIGLEDFSEPPAAPVPPAPGPTLKQLLAPQETAGALKVEEQGSRTLITILGGDLFASGSAAVNPAFDSILQQVAAALERVPGRVLVIGHTDDQRIRSLKFQDNFELSRERAVSVTRKLQQTLTNDARVSWNGVGSSEPRYRPESEPQNRARNRRVEIIHVRGT